MIGEERMNKGGEFQIEYNLVKQKIDHSQPVRASFNTRKAADNKIQVHLAYLFASPLVQPLSSNKYHDQIPPIGFKKEFEGLLEEIDQMKIEFIYHYQQATKNNLISTLSQNPIGLHFSGHGFQNNLASHQQDSYVFGENKSKGKSFLAFEDKNGAQHNIYDEDLKQILKEKDNLKSLKFIVVNSCHSQICGEIFKNCGVQHVICIKAEKQLLDEVAVKFSRIFYQLVFTSSKTICEAFDIAKKDVLSNFNKKESEKFLIYKDDNHDCEIIYSEMNKGGANRNQIYPKLSVIPSQVEPFISRNGDQFELISILNLENVQVVQVFALPGMEKIPIRDELIDMKQIYELDDYTESLVADGKLSHYNMGQNQPFWNVHQALFLRRNQKLWIYFIFLENLIKAWQKKIQQTFLYMPRNKNKYIESKLDDNSLIQIIEMIANFYNRKIQKLFDKVSNDEKTDSYIEFLQNYELDILYYLNEHFKKLPLKSEQKHQDCPPFSDLFFQHNIGLYHSVSNIHPFGKRLGSSGQPSDQESSSTQERGESNKSDNDQKLSQFADLSLKKSYSQKKKQNDQIEERKSLEDKDSSKDGDESSSSRTQKHYQSDDDEESQNFNRRDDSSDDEDDEDDPLYNIKQHKRMAKINRFEDSDSDNHTSKRKASDNNNNNSNSKLNDIDYSKSNQAQAKGQLELNNLANKPIGAKFNSFKDNSNDDQTSPANNLRIDIDQEEEIKQDELNQYNEAIANMKKYVKKETITQSTYNQFMHSISNQIQSKYVNQNDKYSNGNTQQKSQDTHRVEVAKYQDKVNSRLLQANMIMIDIYFLFKGNNQQNVVSAILYQLLKIFKRIKCDRGKGLANFFIAKHYQKAGKYAKGTVKQAAEKAFQKFQRDGTYQKGMYNAMELLSNKLQVPNDYNRYGITKGFNSDIIKSDNQKQQQKANVKTPIDQEAIKKKIISLQLEEIVIKR
ncbi:UNKNOWN [Stylonychia lemnae]|uniref:CHAT domain-containing protein n=1 Tax=Stylonychia lemnae TaxID=5949 RepID=A0A077ZTF5_STYLE|nr:UNKNOWN [Stylonychia lemnae]|eukprot:CDW72615.1 UNKNOWN [Stylonychia lemnae]